jgi:hypothetical protein
MGSKLLESGSIQSHGEGAVVPGQLRSGDTENVSCDYVMRLMFRDAVAFM